MTSKSRNAIVILGVLVLVFLILALAANLFGLLGKRAGESALSGAASRPSNPVVSNTYKLSCPGKFEGFFSKANGVGGTTEVVEHRIVDDKGQELTRLIPGRTIYEKLVLYRGTTADRSAWDWYGLVLAGRRDEAQTTCEFSILDQSFNIIASWSLNNAWPTGYIALSKTELSAAETMSLETLTIVYENLARIK